MACTQIKPRTKSVYVESFETHFKEESDLKASVFALFCLLSDVISFIVSANVPGFTSICTHYVIFLTQKPLQISKDQIQVRVDLQGMCTSLTC